MRATLSSAVSAHPVRSESLLEQAALFASSLIVFVSVLIAGGDRHALSDFNLGVPP